MTIIKNPLQYLCELQEDEIKLKIGQFIDNAVDMIIDPEYFGPFIIEFFNDKPGIVWNYGDIGQEKNDQGGSITTMMLFVNPSMVPGGLRGLIYDLERWFEFVTNNPDVVLPDGDYSPASDAIPEVLKTPPVDLQLDQGFRQRVVDQVTPTSATKMPYATHQPIGTSKLPSSQAAPGKDPMGYGQRNPVVFKKP